MSVLVWILFGYLLFNGLYLLVFAIAGKFYRQTYWPITDQQRRFCILMPVYKNDPVILSTAVAALHHPYAGHHDVVVIADHLQMGTISELRQEGVKVMEVKFSKSTKGKSLQFALENIHLNDYDAVMVLDVDNVMGSDVLAEANKCMAAGYKVVQVHRTAFDVRSPINFLDACNEEINNNIYRKGPAAMGLSAALIGSGMAFDLSFFKLLIKDIDETVGEDKELDFKIAGKGEKIVYLDHVVVRDEKISGAAAFENQRARWLAAQWDVLKKYTPFLIHRSKKMSRQFLNKLAQAWLLPRMLLLAAIPISSLISLMIPAAPSLFNWCIILSMVIVSLLISLPLKFYKEPMFLKAATQIPKAIFLMIKAVLGSGRAGKKFVATEHGR